MSEKVIVTKEKIDSLAEVIGSKSGQSVPLTFEGMEDAVLGIETGIEPTGTLSINENGTHDITKYANAEVNVQPKLQEKRAYLSTSLDQYVFADNGYDGLSRVTIPRVILGTAEVTPNTEEQTVTVENSTTYNVMGLSSVTINPIPSEYVVPILQNKTFSPLIDGGDFDVVADEGFTGLAKVSVSEVPYVETFNDYGTLITIG